MTKTISRTLLTASLLLLASTVGANGQSITDSPHDLSTANTNGTPSTSGTGELCVFCHTPHTAVDPATAPVPLWNRTLPDPTGFTMYSSPSLDGAIATEPQGVSLACLSCHDGATAYDAIINTPADWGTAGSAVMSGSTAVGADAAGLSNDHPISITYGADAAFVSASGGKVASVLPLFRVPGVTTGDGTQVECASCHNPHDWTATNKFLRVANTSSNLCKTCHIK